MHRHRCDVHLFSDDEILHFASFSHTQSRFLQYTHSSRCTPEPIARRPAGSAVQGPDGGALLGQGRRMLPRTNVFYLLSAMRRFRLQAFMLYQIRHLRSNLICSTLAILICACAVSFPLCVIGGISGRNFSTPFAAPVRTTKMPREIPQLPWHRQGPVQIVMAGFLPFSAIYIELYYVFASVWGHKLYSLYGILTLVFAILLVVTSFITIALTYFQLAIEDHHWWWRSLFSGGSTGKFVFLYCIYCE